MRKKITWIVGGLVALYIAVCAGLYVFQTPLTYPARASGGVITAPPEAASPFINVDLTTPDGVDLRGWLKTAKPGYPTIVYFHGNGDNLTKSLRYHPLLLQKDFGLLLTSYRGYSGNKGTPSEQGVYTDAETFMNWIIASGVPEKDIIIYGFSLGTGVATEMAVRHPNAKALILGAPYTTLAAAAEYRFPIIPVDLLMRDKFDNLSKIKKIDMPILIVNGLDDQVFPQEQGKELSEAVSPPDLVTFQQKPGTHTGFFLEHGGDQLVIDWLNRFDPALSREARK